MKPVVQTTFGDGHNEGLPCGNCVAACIASILELDIEDVPNFVMMDHTGGGFWNLLLNEWLAPYNLHAYFLDRDSYISADVYCIGMGLTKRGLYHAVVCLGNSMVWDPYPSKDPDPPEFESFMLFVSKDPAKQK